MSASIKNFIATKVDTNYQLDDDLPFPISVKTFEKHTIITPYHQVEKKAYFLVRGIVKISVIREDGEERILEFFFPSK